LLELLILTSRALGLPAALSGEPNIEELKHVQSGPGNHADRWERFAGVLLLLQLQLWLEL
jgi:hypothetical protein